MLEYGGRIGGGDGVRARALAAAGELLAEHGAEEMSLRGIAERAGIGLASIYHHFENKEDLLLRLALRGFTDLTRAMEASLAAPGPETGARQGPGSGSGTDARTASGTGPGSLSDTDTGSEAGSFSETGSATRPGTPYGAGSDAARGSPRNSESGAGTGANADRSGSAFDGPMRRAARAYLGFADRRAPWFALMFDPRMLSRHAELREAERAAFAVYEAAVRDDSRIPPEHRAEAAAMIWTYGRGLTATHASHPGGRMPADMAETISRGLAWLLDRREDRA